MKIEWTTIESSKNKTRSKINTILGNKSKISVFFAENKKHLFWAWISTMAMAFVVTAWQMSWTEFSANLMYPSLTQEISEANLNEWIVQEEDDLLWNSDSDIDKDLDLDLNTVLDFDDNSEGTEKSEDKIVDKTDEKENSVDDVDNTEDLINDLFWIEDKTVKEEEKEEIKEKEDEVNKNTIKEESEESNLSLFLEDENLHSSAEKNKDKSEENNKENIEEKINETELNKSDVYNIFKPNVHTVDSNLVAQKAMLKDIDDDQLHWSMESFFADNENELIWSWIESAVELNTQSSTQYSAQYNTQSEINNNLIQKTKKLNQTGPEDMLLWLWFLSMILAYFFRRKKV